jgi:hypothetical protein
MAKDDYEIGFGKPPAKTRFGKGTSGNPKGGSKDAKTIATIFAETGRERVTVTINGKTRTISNFRRLLEIPKAFNVVLGAHRQFPQPEESIEAPTVANERDEVPVLDQDIVSAFNPFLANSAVGSKGITLVVDGIEMKGTGVRCQPSSRSASTQEKVGKYCCRYGF